MTDLLKTTAWCVAVLAIGTAAGCSSSASNTSPPATAAAPASREAPGNTSCPGTNCTQQASAATPASALTGPVGTTFTVADYGANGIDATYKIRLMQVAEPATLSDPSQLTAGASHAAALEFWVRGVSGTLSGPDPMYGVQATGTDGSVFSVPYTTAMDTNVYLSSSAASLMPGEHGTWWHEIDLPAGVHVKSVRYLNQTIYTPQDATPVTWTVPVTAAPVAQSASRPSQSQAPAASQPASQAPATQPAAPTTPAGYLGNIFGGGTGNPCNFASGYQLAACNPTGETQSQYIANPGGPAPGAPTNSQGCYYVKMGEGYCPSTGKYIPMQDPNQPSPPPTTPSHTGDPSNGSGTGAACTTVQGYYPAGLPGHEDSSGFCVAD